MVNTFPAGVDPGGRAFDLTDGGTHMKYMLLIHDEEQVWAKLSEAERKRIYGEYGQFCQQVKATGHYRGRRAAAADRDGDQRPGARRQAAAHRRSVRGDARAARRLLPGRGRGFATRRCRHR